MIDCPNGDVRDLLPELLHDRLSAAQRVLVRAHVDACEACRGELALLDSIRVTMHDVPGVDVQAIVASLPAPRFTPVRGGVSRGAWRAIAAALLIAVGGTTLAVIERDDPSSTRSPIARRPELADSGMEASKEASFATAGEPAPRELALAGGTVSDLTDQELASLLGEIESVDLVPSGEVEPPAAEVAPAPRTGGG